MAISLLHHLTGHYHLLKALDIGMTFLKRHADSAIYGRRMTRSFVRRDPYLYDWDRDFPVAFQNRKSGTQTNIRMGFYLDSEEVDEFKKEIKVGLNGSLPIIVSLGRDGVPEFNVSKSGPGSKRLNDRSSRIAKFVADKIIFNYIPAVRTDQEAMEVVSRMLSQRLRVLEDHPKYLEALETIKDLQRPILESLSSRIQDPLIEFLPGIKEVRIETPERQRRSLLRRNFDIIVDDGTPTNLAFKGDGVKSLAALGLLKDQAASKGASIVAIEEPESHLHPSAIHQLNEVVKSISEDSQVILTTHNPLFVDRQDIKTNIIVDAGKAVAAKNVEQIRDLLGIRASDNLTNANYVLVVEGEEDVISLKSLLSFLSPKISKSISSNLLVLDPMGGTTNLPYKLSLLKNMLCVPHVFLDGDDAGKSAYDSAEAKGLISVKDCTFVSRKGFSSSELEDCIDPEVYRSALQEEFGVDLSVPEFRGKGKWSDRVKACFESQGRRWNNSAQAKAKYLVASAIKANPGKALSERNRGSVDTLVSSLESLIEK